MPDSVTSKPSIILCTLNAKYIHASLGLRYLMANMARHGSQALADQTALLEFTLSKPLPDMVLQLLNTLGEELMACRIELPNDSELQNLVDEVMAAVDATQYLLTLK